MVESNTYAADVSVGIYDLSNGENEGQRVDIQNIYMHENYDSSTMHNDIAILELVK